MASIHLARVAAVLNKPRDEVETTMENNKCVTCNFLLPAIQYPSVDISGSEDYDGECFFFPVVIL